MKKYSAANIINNKRWLVGSRPESHSSNIMYSDDSIDKLNIVEDPDNLLQRLSELRNRNGVAIYFISMKRHRSTTTKI